MELIASSNYIGAHLRRVIGLDLHQLLVLRTCISRLVTGLIVLSFICGCILFLVKLNLLFESIVVTGTAGVPGGRKDSPR